MQDFKDLKVWERAHLLTMGVYKATGNFPRAEEYGLKAQLRRACASIPANIAEGCGRGSEKEFAQFLQVAIGSANELEYHLLLARDLGFLIKDDQHHLDLQVTEVRKMLARLVAKVRRASFVPRRA
jgi:four helix bundle protein